MIKSRYKADIAGGALKLQESRVISSLLINEISNEEWKNAIEVDNILQKRSLWTAKRQSSLIRSRLLTMETELWELVQNGSGRTATHALFAAAIKHSTLLSDFIEQVVQYQFRMFRQTLPKKLWGRFIEECYNREPSMPEWRDSTINKMGDSVYRILTEVGYLEGDRNYTLRPIHISSEVMAYLRDYQEQKTLHCIQVIV